jgi:outer membrane protein OmpA-like peptidoglycan-associated protein
MAGFGMSGFGMAGFGMAGRVAGLVRFLTIVPLAAAASVPLAACSVPDSLNPVEWYRDTTGLSKNDPGPEAPNAKNLEAGGQREFPTLGSVPPAPTRALSTEEREAMTQHLLADRANAKYIDEQLRIGPGAAAAPPPVRTAVEPAAAPSVVAANAAPAPKASAPPAPPPAPEAAPAPEAPPAADAAPRESSLTSPEVKDVPQPETPRAAPPPPPADLVAGGQASPAPQSPPPAAVAPPPAAVAPPAAAAPAPVAAAPAAAPAPRAAPPAAAPARQAAQVAALPPAAAPIGEAAGAGPVAQITFANNSARLSAADERTLGEVVPMQQRSGGAVRVVGYAATGRAAGVAQQLASFKMALDRANAVAAALRQAGVEPDRILVEAAPPTGETGVMAQRAEIFLVN